MTSAEAFLLDFRQSLRAIIRSPGVPCVIVLILALTVGSTTTLFSLLNAMVRQLPVRDPQRLVALTIVGDRNQLKPIYPSTFEQFSAQQHVFDDVLMYSGGGTLRVEGRGTETDAGVEAVTGDYFSLLGARPVTGRFFTEEEAVAGDHGGRVVVLSHRLWVRLFNGDSAAVGQTLRVNGVPFTLVGVAAPGFQGVVSDAGADFFVPLAALRLVSGDGRGPVRARNLLAHLRPDVTLSSAQSEVATVWQRLQVAGTPHEVNASEQAAYRTTHMTVESLAAGFSNLRQRYASPLMVLIILSSLLLLIGDANLSALLLSRAIANSEDLAIRTALGATRARVLQRSIAEILLLAVAGMALALPLTWWATKIVSGMLTADFLTPLARPMTPDATVLAVSALTAGVTALVVGGVPAWVAFGAPLWRTIVGAGGRTATAKAGVVGGALLVIQIALSVVLLSAASLFADARSRFGGTGVQSAGARVAWARLWLRPEHRTEAIRGSYYIEVLEKCLAQPGVESASFSMNFPAALNASPIPAKVGVAGAARGDDVTAIVELASPQFFRTVGIPMSSGRDFAWSDDARSAPVAIVNAALAAALFPNGDAIGRPLRFEDAADHPITIVGIVADSAVGNVHEPRAKALFRPLLQEPQWARIPVLQVRVQGDPRSVAQAIPQIISASGMHFVRSVQMLDEQVDRALLQERLLALVSTWFAAVAVTLTSLGIYSLLAYSVTKRTREIGIRVALGASRVSVVRAVIFRALARAGLGFLLGVPIAAASGKIARSAVYGVGTSDGTAIASAVALLIVVALAAASLPAYRAATIDPIDALRQS